MRKVEFWSIMYGVLSLKIKTVAAFYPPNNINSIGGV